jgi:hypothetical protein
MATVLGCMLLLFFFLSLFILSSFSVFTIMSPVRRKEGIHAKRIHEINEAFSKQDIRRLQALATSGPGLVNDGLRRLVW